MARYQYRISGPLRWHSSSGNALLALMNPNGSGRKLVIQSAEFTPLSGFGPTTTYTNCRGRSQLCLLRGTPTGVDTVVAPIKCDTNASNMPSTVRIGHGGGVSSPVFIRQMQVIRSLEPSQSASYLWLRQRFNSRLTGGIFGKDSKDTSVEGVVVRAGEGLMLGPVPDGANAQGYQYNQLLQVTASVTRVGSPNRTYLYRYLAFSGGGSVFTIDNQSGSGETVILKSIAIDEVGDQFSPYFQLVPVGSVLEGQATDTLSVVKMDSSFPDPSNWMTLYADAAILPFGMPENALSDQVNSTLTKSNYLKSKDFLGPVYRAIFPEQCVINGTTLPDTLNVCSQKWSEVFVRKSGITVRPGEGFALVCAAETVAGSSGAGLSGQLPFSFSFVIDIEQEFQPTLSITGLKNPSEVRIFDAGTTTEIAGQENVTSGTFQWVFDPAEYPTVDIAILALNYQNIRLTNFALSMADITIPVQQQTDRQYQNP